MNGCGRTRSGSSPRSDGRTGAGTSTGWVTSAAARGYRRRLAGGDGRAPSAGTYGAGDAPHAPAPIRPSLLGLEPQRVRPDPLPGRYSQSRSSSREPERLVQPMRHQSSGVQRHPVPTLGAGPGDTGSVNARPTPRPAPPDRRPASGSPPRRRVPPRITASRVRARTRRHRDTLPAIDRDEDRHGGGPRATSRNSSM